MRWSAGRARSTSAPRLAHLPLRVYVMGDRAIRLRAGDAGRHRRDAPRSPSRRCAPAPSASPPRARIRTRRRTATWCRRAMPTRRAPRHRLGARRGRRRRLRHEQRFRRRGLRARLDDPARQGDRPPGLVPAHRPLRGPGALAAAAAGRARGARRWPAVDRADRGPADRRHDGHRHRAQSVHGAAELRRSRASPSPSSAARLRDPEVRRQILAEKPSAAEVDKLAQFRQPSPSAGTSSSSWATRRTTSRAPEKSVAAIAAREGRTPDEVAYDYIIEADGQYLYFPVVNYVDGDHEPIREMLTDSGTLLGLERRRRALHLDRRCRPADLHAGALGPRPPPRAAPAAGAPGQAPDQRDRRFLRPAPTAAGWRPACAPTST